MPYAYRKVGIELDGQTLTSKPNFPEQAASYWLNNIDHTAIVKLSET